MVKKEENNKYIISENNLSILFIVFVGSIFGFVIFLGGLINEKIKKRKTNVKLLLYLCASNSFTYWFSIKLLIFTLFFIIPIYFINSLIGY